MVKTFDEWFQSQQGTPYFSYYDFAKAAWKAAQEVEREACAQVAEDAEPDDNGRLFREDVAAAIRARGNK